MASVDVIIKTIDQGSKDAASFAKKLGTTWKDLATPLNQTLELFGKVQAAAASAYEAISEGAALSRAESQFENLTKSIGTTAEALDQELDAATSGMLSHAERVQSASQIISLGLADSQDGVVELASVINELGLDMGTVILTFANDSKMRLDSLGLSVEDVESRIKSFVDQGYAMGEAFDLAVVDALKDRVELLGPAAETAEGKLRQLEAVIKDTQDAFKIGLAEGFTEGLDAGALAAGFEDAADAARQLGENLGNLAGDALPKVIEGAGKVRDLLTSEEFQAGINIAFDQGNTGEAVETIAKAAIALWDKETKGQFAIDAGRVANLPLNEMEGGFQEYAARQAELYLEAFEKEVANRQAAIDLQIAVNQSQLASAREAGAAMGAAMQEGLERESSRWTVDEMAEIEVAKSAGALMGAAMQEGLDAEADRYAPALWNKAATIDQARQDARDAAEAAAEEAAAAFQERVSSMGDSFTLAVEGDLKLGDTKSANEALYEQADAAGASASALALLGVATGQFTEEQAAAALKTAALQEKIELLGQAIASGMDAQTALTQLQDFQTELENIEFDFEPKVELPANLPDDIRKLLGGGDEKIEQELSVGIALDSTTAESDIDAFIGGTYEDITILIAADTEEAATDIETFIADSVEVYTESEYQIVVTAEVGQAISALDTVKAMIAGIDRTIEITVTANTEQFDDAIDRIT